MVNFCAQSGIDDMGVSRPLSNINMMTKKNITNIVCCILSDLLAIATPKPENPTINKIVARYITHNEPAGDKPYTRRATSIAMDITNKPISQ